ncbi:MAG: MFS transporter [Candidatus Nezhaarchaeales archaeon]
MLNTQKGSLKTVVLFTTTLGSFLIPFMGSAVNLALPSISIEFAVDAVTLSWINTSYLLAAAVFLVPLGRLADLHGRRRVFVYGLIIFTVSCLLSALSFSAFLLIFSRILQGIGGAMIFSTGTAILTSVFPVDTRGRALGINVASVYSALSLGPILGGFLTQHFGWRSIFLIVIVLGLITIAVTIRKLSGEWIEAVSEKFDYVGSIIYGLTLTLLIYGFSTLPHVSGVILVLMGILALLTFFIWESRTSNPVLNLSLFKENVTFTFSNLAALINYSATFAISFLLSLYLQYIKGFSPQNAGLILVCQPAVQAILSPFAGRLSDKVEPRIVASTGMLIITIGLILLTFIREYTSLNFIVLTLLLLGFGFALFSSPNTNAIMSSVDKRFYGVASAMLASMRLIGQTLSMGIVALIFALYIGRTQITPKYYPVFLESMEATLTIFSILCFIGIFASLARGKIR